MWAQMDGGRRSVLDTQEGNLQYSLGGGGGIAFIFQPGGLNQMLRPVVSAENMTIKCRTTGFGLKRPRDGVAALLL